eukprot:m.139260 g.139260  ORF g.139260 m.139260 type:complete len:61 (+) comp17613_c0_seq3:124-306(+)
MEARVLKCCVSCRCFVRCPDCNGSRFTPPHTCCADEIGTVDQPLERSIWDKIGKDILGLV